MSEPIELSVEQQFSLRSFQSQVEKMDRGQAQQFLKSMYRQMLEKEAAYSARLKAQLIGDFVTFRP